MKWVLPVLMAASLAACGGGDMSDNTTMNPPMVTPAAKISFTTFSVTTALNPAPIRKIHVFINPVSTGRKNVKKLKTTSAYRLTSRRRLDKRSCRNSWSNARLSYSRLRFRCPTALACYNGRNMRMTHTCSTAGGSTPTRPVQWDSSWPAFVLEPQRSADAIFLVADFLRAGRNN